MCFAVDKYNQYVRHVCAKGVSDSKYMIKQLVNKLFNEIVPSFTYKKKSNFENIARKDRPTYCSHPI